ncbi:MAG TPA: UDP-N-acetylglucosamine 2-epimerase (non-hydrolyzing) [Candidatus Kapabacteria bacterium]|nr:UDP-N-acetylglucosamine 2-epimerase (non-hydrolyzing) [Candidatus Kapabacteria bacterium]
MNRSTRVDVILGTRPEVIKLAPVIAALRAAHVETRVIFTSQHRELAATSASAFGLKPDLDLDLMTPGQSPSQLAARVLSSLDAYFANDPPGLVVVQGDTTTTMSAALAAFHRGIPIAHVEAGLRTDSPVNPFPEEMNRRLATRLATLHCAATEANRQALLRENVPAAGIHVTGNTVIDALASILADTSEDVQPELAKAVAARGNRLLLFTTHRRENFGEPQREILSALRRIVEEHPDLEAAFPVHPNPLVLAAVAEHLPPHPRIHRLEPMDYPAFVRLLAASHLVMTDSGGLQEEGPALGKPVLVLRTTTEREELIRSGGGLLVGVRCDDIVAAAGELLRDPALYQRMAVVRYPFGAAGAAERIARIIRRFITAGE